MHKLLSKKHSAPAKDESGEMISNSSQLAIIKRKKAKLLRILIITLSVILVAGAVFLNKNHRTKTSTDTTSKISYEIGMANKYLQEKNTALALEHAKKALSYAPDDANTALFVADITAIDNPDEAKQLYGRELELFKQRDNPDVDGKHPGTYSAAAVLAEQAGLIDQAKQYYQKAIDAADPSDSDEQNIIKHSQTALERLK